LRAVGDDTPVPDVDRARAVNDRVAGLDAGADDYLVKPFALAELLPGCAPCAQAAENDGEVLQCAISRST